MKPNIKKAYAVVGCTGEYSDYQDWIVRAYTDHAKASMKVAELSVAAANAGLAGNKRGESIGLGYNERQEVLKTFVQHHDENAQCDYTGIEYMLIEFDIEIGEQHAP